ncbi:MAG TPA: hypothetical protein VFQ42_22450 [Mycobacterium sp.]|nr:hypothetical protein [Mycobacterium sp.]
MVTAETITMPQILETYWSTKDASVVRAAICFLHGIPLIASFEAPSRSARAAALECIAAAYNARHGKETP